MESVKNFATNILSPAGDGEDKHTFTKTKDKVEIVKEDSPAENAASLESDARTRCRHDSSHRG